MPQHNSKQDGHAVTFYKRNNFQLIFLRTYYNFCISVLKYKFILNLQQPIKISQLHLTKQFAIFLLAKNNFYFGFSLIINFFFILLNCNKTWKYFFCNDIKPQAITNTQQQTITLLCYCTYIIDIQEQAAAACLSKVVVMFVSLIHIHHHHSKSTHTHNIPPHTKNTTAQQQNVSNNCDQSPSFVWVGVQSPILK